MCATPQWGVGSRACMGEADRGLWPGAGLVCWSIASCFCLPPSLHLAARSPVGRGTADGQGHSHPACDASFRLRAEFLAGPPWKCPASWGQFPHMSEG